MSAKLRLSADHFFWAVVDGQGWKKSGPLPRGLLPAFADEVPIPVEDLHVVCTPGRSGRLVACGIQTETLSGVGLDVISLAPAALPAFVEDQFDPESLEFLVGPYEPRPVRRRRIRRHVIAMSTVVGCSAFLAIGLDRRADTWSLSAAAMQEQTLQLVSSVLPGGRPDSLTLEVMRLSDGAALPDMHPPPDASVSLVRLLSAWPAQIASKPQSMTIAPDLLSASTVIEGNASSFLKALRPPEGWRMDEPRLNSTGDSTRITLLFRPAGSKP